MRCDSCWYYAGDEVAVVEANEIRKRRQVGESAGDGRAVVEVKGIRKRRKV